MYTRIGKQKLANTLNDYSSGGGLTFGLDKNMVTTAETIQYIQNEAEFQSKSLPSSHKKKKAPGRFNDNEGMIQRDVIK